MKFFAVVSDIHANLPALHSVIADAEQMVGKFPLFFICLGDVVDYGPHPNPCMKWIEEDHRVILKICGNHDQEMESDLESAPKIDNEHWAFTLWTRKKLFKSYRTAISKWCGHNSVNGHKITELKQFVFIHGGLEGHLKDMTDTDIPNLRSVKNIDEAKRQFNFLNDRNALFGHTHYQGYFLHHDHDDIPEMRLAVPNGYGRVIVNQRHQLFEVPQGDISWKDIPWEDVPDQGIMLNPGSVGQPRWHSIVMNSNPSFKFSPLACYLLLKADRKGLQFAFRQCKYNSDTTISALKKIYWPANSTKDEIKSVAELLKKAQHVGNEHSAYRQAVEKSSMSHSESLITINQRLQFEIQRLIRALDINASG